MGLRTSREYISGVLSRPRVIYVAGERVDNPYEHPVLRPLMESIARTFDLALLDEYRGVLTAKGLRGEEVNRFLHIDGSVEDLLLRVEAMRIVNRFIGNCNYRCVGHDALNALFAATYDVDKDLGTEYHKRLRAYVEYVQHNDLVVAGAMTDVRGDRSKRPGEQPVKDAYVHIVEERRDGIVVSGAKIHTSGAMLADEIVVIPVRAFRPSEKEFAVAFAVPANAKGLYFVSAWNSMDALRKVSRDLGVDIDVPTPYGHRQTSMIIFDEVFVPRERVFLAGEAEYTARLVEYFVAHHRGGGAGCKAGFADIVIGASALMAEANGILGAKPVMQKLAEMKYHAEAAYAAGVAAAVKGWKHPSGAYIPDTMLANVAKLEAVTHLKEVIVAAADLGGGIVVGAPSAKDLEVPGIGERLRKLLQANPAYSAEDRLRAARLLEIWTAGTHLVGLIQGGGPPATQLLSITRLLEQELPKLIENAKNLAGVKGAKQMR